MVRATVLLLAVMPFMVLGAQTAADSNAIRQAALDYIEGYYEGDGARMERALHPELAKRIVRTNDQGRSQLQQMSAMSLVLAHERAAARTTGHGSRKDVTIFDIYQNAASAKIYASGWSTTCISRSGMGAG